MFYRFKLQWDISAAKMIIGQKTMTSQNKQKTPAYAKFNAF